MPIYEFVCEKCKESFEELLLRASAIEEVRCPSCSSSKIHKQLSLIANSGSSTSASTSNACTTST